MLRIVYIDTCISVLKLIDKQEAYGMKSLFPRDWSNLILRFMNDSHLMAKYD